MLKSYRVTVAKNGLAARRILRTAYAARIIVDSAVKDSEILRHQR